MDDATSGSRDNSSGSAPARRGAASAGTFTSIRPAPTYAAAAMKPRHRIEEHESARIVPAGGAGPDRTLQRRVELVDPERLPETPCTVHVVILS
jgi:hypothetical protein